jgi:hypothetical protein
MVDAHAANDEVLRSLEVHRLGPVPAVNFVRVKDGISNHGALETIVVFLAVGFGNLILFSRKVGALEGKSTIKAEAEDLFAIIVDNGLTWRVENDAFWCFDNGDCRYYLRKSGKKRSWKLAREKCEKYEQMFIRN